MNELLMKWLPQKRLGWIGVVLLAALGHDGLGRAAVMNKAHEETRQLADRVKELESKPVFTGIPSIQERFNKLQAERKANVAASVTGTR